jgi:glycosyltransferase involved in cell wall biosynthesis
VVRASVIVPARDAEATLPALLAGLGKQTIPGGHEVIVVDNGSRDATAAEAKRASVVTSVVVRPRGEGPGAARNAGVAASVGELLAFIDADCVPADGWLAHGGARLEDCDIVQGRVAPDPAVRPGPFDRTLSVGRLHGLFESANLFVRRDLFERLGGFPPGLERSGAPFGEDAIFGWRAVRAGARAGFCPEALVHHAVFRRGAAEFVAERQRLALFPALAKAAPELRDSFFYKRLFLTRRAAVFDLAVLGAGAGLIASRLLPLAAVAPYAGLLLRDADRWGVRCAPVTAAADAVGLISLLRGSLEARSLLL